MERTKPTRSVALALSALLTALVPAQEPRDGKPPATAQLAVIVNPKNPTTGLTLAELRSHFKLEIQFWSNNQRTVLYLRPGDSVEMKILLERIYGMTQGELRKYWIGRVFRGEIPATPTVVPTSAAGIARVREQEGAFAVVLADAVPEGVRVLAIDGKRPGDAGYPLTGQAPVPPAPGPSKQSTDTGSKAREPGHSGPPLAADRSAG